LLGWYILHPRGGGDKQHVPILSTREIFVYGKGYFGLDVP
jgi:hypothetical protein